jgi:hypothetical protein
MKTGKALDLPSFDGAKNPEELSLRLIALVERLQANHRNVYNDLMIRQVNDAGMAATAGKEGMDIVYNQADNKYYGCTVTGSPATWAAFH